MFNWFKKKPIEERVFDTERGLPKKYVWKLEGDLSETNPIIGKAIILLKGCKSSPTVVSSVSDSIVRESVVFTEDNKIIRIARVIVGGPFSEFLRWIEFETFGEIPQTLIFKFSRVGVVAGEDDLLYTLVSNAITDFYSRQRSETISAINAALDESIAAAREQLTNY